MHPRQLSQCIQCDFVSAMSRSRNACCCWRYWQIYGVGHDRVICIPASSVSTSNAILCLQCPEVKMHAAAGVTATPPAESSLISACVADAKALIESKAAPAPAAATAAASVSEGHVLDSTRHAGMGDEPAAGVTAAASETQADRPRLQSIDTAAAAVPASSEKQDADARSSTPDDTVHGRQQPDDIRSNGTNPRDGADHHSCADTLSSHKLQRPSDMSCWMLQVQRCKAKPGSEFLAKASELIHAQIIVWHPLHTVQSLCLHTDQAVLACQPKGTICKTAVDVFVDWDRYSRNRLACGPGVLCSDHDIPSIKALCCGDRRQNFVINIGMRSAGRLRGHH